MTRATRLVAGLTAATLLAAALGIGATRAQDSAKDYPSHTVRIIVGYGAGAQADTPARLLAQKFSVVLGQQFVVENKPGAGGNLAAAYVAHTRGDGYTLLMATSAQSVYAATTLDPAYDVKKDFAPIIQRRFAVARSGRAPLARRRQSARADCTRQTKTRPNFLRYVRRRHPDPYGRRAAQHEGGN